MLLGAATKSGSISEDPSSTCGACNGNVESKEKAMQCDLCNRWTHNSCCSMPDDLYKVLVKHEKKNTRVNGFASSVKYILARSELRSN